MKYLLAILLVLVALIPADAGAAKKIQVVTTIPDLADMTRKVAGDLADVTSIATGVEDIHAVPMKPKFAVLLNRADVVILMGLEAEHAFLPALLDASRNPKIRRDAPGYIDTSVYVPVLEVPSRLDPTPSHVADLIERMRQAKVEIVVRERHYPAGLAETVAKATGAKLVELPAMVGGVPEADNYIAFIDYNIRALVKAATGG